MYCVVFPSFLFLSTTDSCAFWNFQYVRFSSSMSIHSFMLLLLLLFKGSQDKANHSRSVSTRRQERQSGAHMHNEWHFGSSSIWSLKDWAVDSEHVTRTKMSTTFLLKYLQHQLRYFFSSKSINMDLIDCSEFASSGVFYRIVILKWIKVIESLFRLGLINMGTKEDRHCKSPPTIAMDRRKPSFPKDLTSPKRMFAERRGSKCVCLCIATQIIGTLLDVPSPTFYGLSQVPPSWILQRLQS